MCQHANKRNTVVLILATLHGSAQRVSESFYPNQKLAQALTSTPKAIVLANTSCYLATFGTNTAS